jgi:hypothetical protein
VLNGRLGRLVMHLQIAEGGQPLFPLEAAIRRSRQSYLAAIDEAIASGQPEPFLRFLITACADAIRIGRILLEELRPIQLRLTAALRETQLVTRRHPLLIAQLMAHLVLEHRDFDYIFELPSHGVIRLLEKSYGLETIDVDGQSSWIIPGLQDAIKRAIAC